MTAAQRRRQNQVNATRSTGPKTDEGQQRSRQNALKHGLTAEVLTPHGEDPQAIQDQLDVWTDACEPQSHDEDVLVETLALNTIRLKRCAMAETEVISDQVRSAETEWDRRQKIRLLDAKELMQPDPARALIELESFGLGVNFLLETWRELKTAFDTQGCWNNLGLIKQVVRLSGADPDRLWQSPVNVYELVFQAASYVKNVPNGSPLEEYAQGSKPSMWIGLYGNKAEHERGEARRLMSAAIDRRIAELTALKARFDGNDLLSRAGSTIRALVPLDTPGNRLLVRYTKSAESSFDRALKSLKKLQTEREKKASAASEADVRNEAESPSEPTQGTVLKGTCVDPGAAVPEEKTVGEILMELSLEEARAKWRAEEAAERPCDGV